MKNLLCTYEKEMPTVSMLRVSAETRSDLYDIQFRFKHIMEVTRDDLIWCDVIHCIRPNDPYSVFLASLARRMGRVVISFYDDDLYNLLSSHPNPFWRKKSIPNILKNSTLLLSSSRHICNKYKKFVPSGRTFASDTAVDPEEIKRIPPLEPGRNANRKVKLVYAANPGHTVFFDRFVLPVMPQLCQRYGDSISLTFMGLKPDLSAYESQMEINYIPGMGLEEYRKKIKEGNYDIGLSPLITDEFTKCKYFNKFIEYTMAGIVGVYSNTEPYTYVVRDGVNGFLADDTTQAWLNKLSLAIDDALLRNRCICNAQTLLVEEFNLQRANQKMNDVIPELMSYDAPKNVSCRSLTLAKLGYRIIRLLDKAYLFGFYFRQGGFSLVMKKIRS